MKITDLASFHVTVMLAIGVNVDKHTEFRTVTLPEPMQIPANYFPRPGAIAIGDIYTDNTCTGLRVRNKLPNSVRLFIIGRLHAMDTGRMPQSETAEFHNAVCAVKSSMPWDTVEEASRAADWTSYTDIQVCIRAISF